MDLKKRAPHKGSPFSDAGRGDVEEQGGKNATEKCKGFGWNGRAEEKKTTRKGNNSGIANVEVYTSSKPGIPERRLGCSQAMKKKSAYKKKTRRKR